MDNALDFYAAIDRNILRTGQHLMAVFADGDDPAFIYTIGNALQGLPELLLVGNFDRAVTGTILNVLGARMRAERQPLEGDLEFGAASPARVRRATAAAKQRFTIQAGRFLRHEEYDVLQLLLCDPAGVYPDGPECAPGFDVPLA